MTDIDATPQSLNFLAGGGEMGALIRAYDWQATPLGAPEGWPQSLKTAVRIMLTSRQPIWIGWGEHLIYLYNDPYQSIIGGKHPWALGRPAAEVWREIWPDIGPMLATAMGGLEGTYVEEQLLIMERNGYPEETYYTFSYSPIPDDAGAPGGIICANTDDTQRVIGERQLALLRDLAARTVDARAWRDACARSGEALRTNPKDITFALLYVATPDSDGLTLAEAVSLAPDHPAAPAELDPAAGAPWPIDRVMASHDPLLIERLDQEFSTAGWDRPTTAAAILPIQPSSDTGRAGVLIVGLNPYRLFGDDYRGFLGLVAGQIGAAIASADAYEEERRRVEALAELDRAKTAFFSNVSHEFRTPLTLMLGPLEEILAGEHDPDTMRQQVALAHRNGARLLRLVNSLLDFSRIEAGRVRASYEPTDLASYSRDIAASFRSTVERAGLALDFHCETLPQPVYVDRDMWEKVLLNLISNAFKFTLEGRIGIAVRPDASGKLAIVEVSDTGIGIAPGDLPRLFDRFHRVEGSRGRSFEGSGIGLALVHEIVKLHGAQIAVDSEPGRGTTFAITLPFGTAHLPADHIVSEAPAPTPTPGRAQEYVEEASRWLPSETRPSEPVSLPASGLEALTSGADRRPGLGKSILLADDNVDMRSYVARLLEAQGYAVTAVADGEAAFAAARTHTPDLLLTDVMMPKLDGFGLLRAIRDDQKTAGVPVIMLSARAGEEAKIEGLDAGADDYLIKPFAARELLARVNANIQLAQVRREANRALFQSEQRYLMTQDRLSLALSTGRVAVFEWSVGDDAVVVQGPLAEVFGVTTTEAESGLPLATFLGGIHQDDREGVIGEILRSVETAKPYEAEYRVTGAGREQVVTARGRVEADAAGAQRLVGVVIDITEERAASNALKASRSALETHSRALELLNQTAAAISGDLDLERLVQTVIDAAVELTGAEFGAFFYNVADEAGERYTLYSLSGAPREAFSKFPMPRNTPVFEPTFAGTGVVRSDDITKDPRYGTMTPHRGMPKGHLPVRSYLAVPVRSRDGDVLGGLFFGHSQCGMFDEVSEDRVVGLAAQAAVAIDNARLFQEAAQELQQRRHAETQLQELNARLEERVAEEVAERAKAEEALRQAQKMEAVGQLTGGVAHDFNNLLTVIIGGLDTIKRSKPEDEARIRRAVDMALQGAERAASLTGRLLAFSRRQPLAPMPLDLNLLVRDMTELLHRTLGEHIELEGVLAPRLWSIEADKNQLESAIINLAVNARDAMPDGGKLTIETTNTALDESYAAVDTEVIPGQYVAVAVSDTGHGMSEETRARVFEPFFTTKDVGRGTGLGLSMVYGFVKQSGGHVTIYSEESHGTTVKLYFPRYLGGGGAEVEPTVERLVPRSSAGEVVLVVEDHNDVRAYSTMILNELGYQVIEAAEANAALRVLKTEQRVDLLFTDIVLPGMNGRALADEAIKLRPDLRILFTTGYSRNAIVHHGRLDAGVQLLTKPFTLEQLATRVRSMLDEGSAYRSAG